MAQPRVTVIVPVRDDAAGLQRLLARLAAQTLPAKQRELIVVDDASRDDAVGAVAERAGARVLRLERAGGSYAARNAALARADGDVLAFTDADCLPRPDWLERGLAALESADLVAGHVEMLLSPRPTTAELIDLARHLHQERNVAAGFGATANLLVRRVALDRLGGFEERVRSGGDHELGRRATAAGLRLVYAADAVVEHPARRSGRAVMRKSLRLARSRAAFARLANPHLGSKRAIWPRPGAWLPNALLGRSEVYGIERVQAAIGPLGARRRVALRLGEWAYVQLPLVAGDLIGSLAASRARIGRSRPGTLMRAPLRAWRGRRLASERAAGLARLEARGDSRARAIAAAARVALGARLDPDARRWTERIEGLRRQLLERDDPITVRASEYRDDPRDARELVETVAQTCRTASRPPLWSVFLLALARETAPRCALELGTCLGLSAAFQAAGMQLAGGGRLVTIDASAERTALARENLAALGLGDVEVLRGRFQEILAPALERVGAVDYAFVDGHHDEAATIAYFEAIARHAADGAVIVVDDITWSAGMARAWRTVTASPRVTLAVDLGEIGICVLGGDGERELVRAPLRAPLTR